MKMGSALVLGLVLVGCATPRTDLKGVSGLKISQVQAIVAVCPLGTATPFNYVTPMEKEEALERGLHNGLLAAAEPGGIFVMPLTLSIGAAQGLRGKTSDEISRAEIVLTSAAAELDFCERLCEQLVECGPKLTGYTWLLAKTPPAHFDNIRSAEVLPEDQVVLVIDLPAFALEPILESNKVAVNPTLRLSVEARCRIVNAVTSQEMGEQRVWFGAGLHKFLTWAQNDATKFRIQANRGSRVLAEKLIKSLFPAKSTSS